MKNHHFWWENHLFLWPCNKVYPLAICYTLRTWTWPIEIGVLPIGNGDLPVHNMFTGGYIQLGYMVNQLLGWSDMEVSRNSWMVTWTWIAYEELKSIESHVLTKIMWSVIGMIMFQVSMDWFAFVWRENPHIYACFTCKSIVSMRFLCNFKGCLWKFDRARENSEFTIGQWTWFVIVLGTWTPTKSV